MTAANLEKDLQLTFQVINYLNAAYRGKFAALNMLSQLQFRALDSGELLRSEKTLETIERWQKDLVNKMPLLSLAWKTPETFEGKRALDLCLEMKAELNTVAVALDRILAKSGMLDTEDAKFLIASYGRYSYSRDNYTKGFIEFGRNFGRADILEQYSQLLPESAENIQISHSLLREGKLEKAPDNFEGRLKAAAYVLPPIFRTYMHELTQLSCAYDGEFTYELADFSRPEGQRWAQAGISPFAAGYWRAYGLDADESGLYMQQGIDDPHFVGAWKRGGFDFKSSLPWIRAGIPVALGIKWAAAGYTAEEAGPFISKGIEDPAVAGKKV